MKSTLAWNSSPQPPRAKDRADRAAQKGAPSTGEPSPAAGKTEANPRPLPPRRPTETQTYAPTIWEKRASIATSIPILTGVVEELAPVGIDSDEGGLALLHHPALWSFPAPAEVGAPHPGAAAAKRSTGILDRESDGGERHANEVDSNPNANDMRAEAEDASDSLPPAVDMTLNEGVLLAGRYRLLRLLGRGASGSVWEAKHLLLASRVAIKFLDTLPGADAARAHTLLDRFRFEAQICARLSSHTKNIVSVHDVGLHDSIPYIVMEFAPGESLESRLQRRALKPTEVLTMLHQIGQALDSAHEEGIAHRDVKPANILCLAQKRESEQPIFKLADFGVAKQFGDRILDLTPPKETSESVLVGSPAYMSPEYLAGSGIVDGRPDLWALAICAYETLTQQLPFDAGGWTQLALQIVQARFTMPSELVPALSPSLDAFFRRALHRNPEERYQTAAQLTRGFEEALRASLPDTQIALRSFRPPTPSTPSPAVAAEDLRKAFSSSPSLPSSTQIIPSSPPPAGARGSQPTPRSIHPRATSGERNLPEYISRRSRWATFGVLALLLTAGVVAWRVVASDKTAPTAAPQATGTVTATAELPRAEEPKPPATSAPVPEVASEPTGKTNPRVKTSRPTATTAPTPTVAPTATPATTGKRPVSESEKF